MKRRSDAGHPSARDIAEVASGRGSSGDKRELYGYATRHHTSAAYRALKHVKYRPRFSSRRKKAKP
jgi:hypothetical protein